MQKRKQIDVGHRKKVEGRSDYNGKGSRAVERLVINPFCDHDICQCFEKIKGPNTDLLFSNFSELISKKNGSCDHGRPLPGIKPFAEKLRRRHSQCVYDFQKARKPNITLGIFVAVDLRSGDIMLMGKGFVACVAF
jgi:hypothetical protein